LLIEIFPPNGHDVIPNPKRLCWQPGSGLFWLVGTTCWSSEAAQQRGPTNAKLRPSHYRQSRYRKSPARFSRWPAKRESEIVARDSMAESKYLTAPLKTDKMPPGVPYIVGNEAAERFSYYGMNSILVIFMTKYLLDRHGDPNRMTDAQADAWYHTFVSCLYFLPVLGAFLADAVLGKYLVILSLSIVYCFGHLTLAIDHTRLGLVIGLGLIALGAGGIKPCVSANVGDQFGASNQHLLPRVFSWFYFAINFGSTFSTLLIPWMLDPNMVSPELAAKLPVWLVHFLDKLHGPEIAFGTPGILMFIATVIFWLGRKKFVHLPPAESRTISENSWIMKNSKHLVVKRRGFQKNNRTINRPV